MTALLDQLPAPRRPVRHAPALHHVCAAGLLALAAGQAQASGAAGAGTGAAAGDESSLISRIRAAVGDARCSSDAQCRTLPLGEKACGGPERWLAWSTTSAQADPLPGWAAELAALARERNARSGMLSNCQYNADPGAVCRDQRCVLGTPVLVR